MAGGIKVGQNKFVSMTTDFGHSPIGRLGGRKVEVGQGAKPRLPFGPIQKGVGLLGRMANALTPMGRRVQSKVLAGLEDFGKSVGNTLGSLVPREDGKPDFKNLLSDLAALRKEAVPLTKRGTDYQELLKARVGMALSQLSEKGLANLLTTFSSQEMFDFRLSLSEGPDPEQLRVMDAVGEGETLQEETKALNDMDEDLGVIQDLVQAEAEKRMGKEMGSFREVTGKLFEHGADPAEDPRLFANQMEDVRNAYDKIVLHAEAMGSDMPLETQDLQARVDQLHYDTEERCVQAGNRFLEHSVDPRADPNGFARQLGQALDLMESLHRVEVNSGQEPHQEITDLKERIGQKLAELKTGSLDVGGLSPRNTGRMISAMRAFGLHGLDEELGAHANLIRQDVQKAYNLALVPCLDALKSQDHQGVLDAFRGLFEQGEQCLKALQDLGDKYEGSDDLLPMKARFLENALAGMDTDDLVGVSQAMHSTRMLQFQDLMTDAGYGVMGQGRSLPPGMRDAGEKTGTAMITVVSDLEMLGGMLNARLAKEFIPELPKEEVPKNPLQNLPPEAMESLRHTFGVGQSPTREWEMTGTHGPAPDPHSTKVSTGVVKCLDCLAMGELDPLLLIHASFGINSRVGIRHPEVQDPGEIRQLLKGNMLKALENSSDLQLGRIHLNLTSPQTADLRLGLSKALESGPEGMSQNERDGRAVLVSTAETLEVLEEALGEVMRGRNLQAPPRLANQGTEVFSRANENSLAKGLNQVRTWLSVPQESRGQGTLEGPHREDFDAVFFGPEGSQTREEALDLEGQGLGVCRQMRTDAIRAHFSIEENGQTQTLFQEGKDEEEKVHNGVDGLLKFCDNDKDLLFKVSKRLNHSVLSGFYTAMKFGDPQSPFALSDGQARRPIFGGNSVSYSLSKDQTGNIKVHVEGSYRFANLERVEGKDLSDFDIPMDGRSGGMVVEFDVTIPREGKETVGPVSYEYQANRSGNLV